MPRKFSVFVAVLVISATVFGGLSPQPAQAQTAQHCTEFDEFLWNIAFPIGSLVNALDLSHCDPSTLSDMVGEYEGDIDNATKTGVYSSGQQLDATDEQWFAVAGNYLDDDGNVVMAKAEAAIIAEIDQGGTRQEVKDVAEDAVEDYYSRKQMNLVDKWGVAAETTVTMEAAVEANNNGSFVEPVRDGDGGATLDADQVEPTQQGTVTLVNGSSVGATEWCGRATGPTTDDLACGGPDDLPEQSGGFWQYLYVEVETLDGQPSFIAFDMREYVDQWNEYESKNAQMEANAIEYADAVYNGTESGNFTTEDYLSCGTISQEFSTDYETTGYYAYVVGWLSCQGMEVPAISNTSLMTISHDGDEYQGLIVTQHEPSSGSWETNKVYDPDLIQGYQGIATTDSGVVELNETFIIQSMEDPEGNQVSETTVVNRTYVVTNETASYAETQDVIRAMWEEINSLDIPTGGSGASAGAGSIGWVGIAVAAGLAVLVLFGRNQ